MRSLEFTVESLMSLDSSFLGSVKVRCNYKADVSITPIVRYKLRSVQLIKTSGTCRNHLLKIAQCQIRDHCANAT